VGDLPRTLTGGVVDSMKTKLEMMVAYMGGRKGDGAELIRRELADPTSDASLCLEAVRSRSRGIFGADLPAMPGPIPSRSIRKGATERAMAGRRLPTLLVCASSAALVFIAVGMAWRAQEDRLRHLEATLGRRDTRWGDRFDRLEAVLARRELPSQAQPVRSNRPDPQELKPTTPADGPTTLALARIEARLGELGQRLGEGQARLDQDDQQVAQLRRDLNALKQEMNIAVQANKQGSQELSAAVREILQLLRHLTLQSRAMQPMQVPVPIPFQPHGHEPGVGQGTGMISGPSQVPGQSQMPGKDQSYRAPGRGKR
jgi:hypothetical protein